VHVSLGSESNSTAKKEEDTSALQYKKTFLEREIYIYMTWQVFRARIRVRGTKPKLRSPK
jgi:hypothetical protein